MIDSLSGWLALRESADWRARSAVLVQKAAEAISSSDAVNGLDLCSGTGSNMRYLIDRLPRRQRWLLVDRDASLLNEVAPRLSAWAQSHGGSSHADGHTVRVLGERYDCVVEMRSADLGYLDPAIFEGRNLVTASALLDLASESWLRSLAERCRTVGATALFSLTYTGESSCVPAEPEDDMVRELLNAHQTRDKGLGGAAAGPQAWAIVERVFEESGYAVQRAASDWSIPAADRDFQRELIEGWAHAGLDMAPDRAVTINDWLQRRLNHVAAGHSSIVVKHMDMVATLTEG